MAILPDEKTLRTLLNDTGTPPAVRLALLDSIGGGSTPGATPAAGSQSASAAQRGVAGSGGATVDAGPGNKPTGGGSTGSVFSASGYSTGTGGVTEPWAGTMPTAQPFSYGPAPTYGGSQYDNRRDQLLTQLEGQRFSYDPATDPVWQAYQKQYRREGQRATEDALGRAAGMTGGVPSSYAVGAAAQAGNQYAAQLSDRLPQLYNDAYNRYLKEYERQLGLADTYNSLGQQEYNQYLDRLGQFNKDRSFAYGVYGDDYNRARQQYLDRYQEYLDEQNRRTGERSWAYGVEQDERQRALDEEEREYQRGLDAEQKARQDYLDQVAAAELGAGLGDYSGYRDLGYDTSGLENLDYAYASDGSTYRIGTDKARYFILNAPVGQTMQGGDGSVWEKREDGSVTITKGGKVYTIGGGPSEAPATQAGQNPPTNPANPVRTPTPEPQEDPAATALAQNIQNGYAAADVQSFLHDIGQIATEMPSGNAGGTGATGNYGNLDYDEDEGIFTWNGKRYSHLGQLASDINKALESGKITAKQEKELLRRLDVLGFDVSKTSGNGGK